MHLADGSTNVLPVGSTEQVHAAWRLHHDLVRRCLERAYYQGWDMHPGHLPTRYIANFAFYREGFAGRRGRLSAYVHRDATGILDEPATARALARYLYRGYVCGAVDSAELEAAHRAGRRRRSSCSPARSPTPRTWLPSPTVLRAVTSGGPHRFTEVTKE